MANYEHLYNELYKEHELLKSEMSILKQRYARLLGHSEAQREQLNKLERSRTDMRKYIQRLEKHVV